MIPPLPDLISEHGFGHRSSNNRFVVEYKHMDDDEGVVISPG